MTYRSASPFSALRDNELKILLIVASTLWIYSSLLKFPFLVPSNYSDVGYLWIRDVYQGQHNLQIPYVDYELEYPQVIGGLILIGQAISTYFPFVIDQYNTFVVVESILQYPFMIGTIIILFLLCQKLKINRTRIYLYILSTLTFVVYGFYNWDFVVAFFTTLAIWLYVNKRYDGSALALAVAVLTKFIPGIMLPAMVVGLPDNKARMRFLAISVLTWLGVNAPFALSNFGTWAQLFVGYSGPNHQLQNTWISMVISTAGLGDIISGARAGHVLSFAIIGYLVLRAITSDKTPLDKILLSWYAWYGAIYLFDPQMFVQLFPIIVLTPDFNFVIYRIADLFNAFIILFYFIGSSHPELPRYITDQLTPFGLINTFAAVRQLIFLGAYFVAFNPKRQSRLKHCIRTLVSPVRHRR
ncbi:MAG TPA: hypothetical protein VJZ32_04745 [Candidatus Bathyarchaeia archaeon]|nr:hypothetical protein [Candidatus Bathyarchaeia archaeon]